MAQTRLTPTIDLEELSPEDAFAVLGNETRLEIVRSLWEASAFHKYDDLDDSSSAVSFSELRRRVGVEDTGRFNYHLSELSPHFVLRTESGYRLSAAGKKIARTVVAVSSGGDPDITGDLETDCPVCGATIQAVFNEGWLRFECTECRGLFGDTNPEGTILYAPWPAAGSGSTDADQRLVQSIYRCHLDLSYMMQGVCRECAGTVTGSLAICDDHTTEDHVCPTCGSPFRAWGELRCETCRFAKRLPLELCVLGTAPAIGFLFDEGINMLAPSIDDLVQVLGEMLHTEVSTEPTRAKATVTAEDDSVTISLNRNLDVVAVDH